MRNFILRHAKNLQGLSYKFTSGSCSVRWPKEDGKGLGMTGAWNLLFRAGVSPKIIDGCLPVPERGDTLFVTADETFSSKTEKALQNWMKAGGKVLACGCPEAWRFVFPENTRSFCFPDVPRREAMRIISADPRSLRTGPRRVRFQSHPLSGTPPGSTPP